MPAVLIVGAGPSGLMLACQLARLGVPFRIVDKGSGPTTQSRALVIQARSMEILAQLGLADAFTAQGLPARAINYVVEGKLASRIPLSGFGRGLTAFPYLLVLEQSKTERILLAHLTEGDHDVEWDVELTALAQTPESVTATLRHADGTTETATAGWLVGADGARSQVREGLGIPFAGKTYEHKLFVLDCKVSWAMPSDEMYVAFSRRGFGAFFPMPDGRCRVAGILPKHLEDRDAVTFEEIRQDFASRLHADVALSDPSWVALYNAHHRYAATFRDRRCFLVGDAAHIHSPVGAQGMNTGLQDAYNLAWKLALVSRGRAAERLLDSYTAERLPVARSLVRTTDRAFSVTVSGNQLTRLGPLYVAPRLLPLALKAPYVGSLIFRAVSEIGIDYRRGPLAREASEGGFPRHAPRPGDRLPFVMASVGGVTRNVQEYVDGIHLCVLVFSDAPSPELGAVVAQHPELLSVITIPPGPDNDAAYRAFGIGEAGYYVVRPDMYVGCRSATLSPAPLKRWLHRLLTT